MKLGIRFSSDAEYALHPQIKLTGIYNLPKISVSHCSFFPVKDTYLQISKYCTISTSIFIYLQTANGVKVPQK